MTSDEIADEIVALYQAATGLAFPFQVSKPLHIEQVEAIDDAVRVYVIAKDETEEAIDDRGSTCKRTRVVSVAINGPLRTDRTLGDYLGLVESLREALEGTQFEDYLWDRNDTISLWDRTAVTALNRFLALFEATYYTFS